ncbi:polysaccharide pyruvyl transferase family protein [Streptomyces sp. ML-6]|uniref:polysaccharide pyruvyl transferase family protein n=1 Tax=unclassified Streptomyces TaxID=2593676 RepID=UPI0024C08BDD|nr:polysaccharide pyruvyl transferase family protein [Streptomyces sp. ML-6]MDK0523628.1 polysaccharide pyruvyl transferase family protein [Streptomyces sp. ML-6]
MASNVNGVKRILLRSGKSPYDVVPVERALHEDVFATNSGNLIFSDAAHKILRTPRSEVVSNGIATRVADAGRINEEYDVFVVPLANAFRPSFERQLERLTQLISKLKIPVVVPGVGAQTGVNYSADRLKPMQPTVYAFVSAVLDHSASIGVRGEFTERYLRDMGFRDVDVIGCPSMFLHGDRLTVREGGGPLGPGSRIAVNGSHDAVRKHKLGQIIDRTHAYYPHLRFIGQNISEARQLHWRDMSHPNASLTTIPTHPDHPMYGEDKVRVYIDPATWMEDLRGFDFSFGSRIHGNIAALLAGTPATVLCGDSRTLELCRYFEIPHRMLSKVPADLDPADLYAEADFGPLTRGHRERFDRFMNFLDKNGLENTFTHGDGGAAFEAEMSKLAFPPGVRPWTGTDVAATATRMNWLQSQLTELATENAQLQRKLSKTSLLPSQRSTYQRARSAVGRPLKRALRPSR